MLRVRKDISVVKKENPKYIHMFMSKIKRELC